MNRAERRRAEKARQKGKLATPANISNYSMQQISNTTGAKIESLKTYLSAREEEIHQGYIEEFQEKLLKAEDYIAVANILISLLAIKMTWGFTKANQKFLDNINPATEYLNRNGVEKVYKELQEQMGINIGFESMDLNKEFGFGGEEDD